MDILPPLQLDGYKTDHRRQYPSGTELVYSNLTARGSRIEGIQSTVFFGLQYYCRRYLLDYWGHGFFIKNKKKACQFYKDTLESYCGLADYKHIEDLHDLGYLPVRIKAVKEGTQVPIRCPMMTIYNTIPDFYWVTNALETSLSNILWMPITAATIANRYREVFEQFADETCDNRDFVPFQGHDFSYRGLPGLEAALLVGSGHLTSFVGTDTIPAIPHLDFFYGSDSLIGCSVPATEHSVMCLGQQDDEIETIRRLITEVYPTGIVSIVCDTWDFWKVVTEYLPKLKNEIMSREGKVVIRPDSGDPADIICGTKYASEQWFENNGLIECLWDIFGGTENSKGYRVLDSHIGAIYGDSITMDRQRDILERLKENKFASSNIVLGIGSFSYQYNTRDTFGMAVKSTYGEVNGQSRNIFKNPKTDDGLKKSMRGLLRVNDDFSVDQEVSWADESGGVLETVFEDGNLIRRQTLDEVRSIVRGATCLA